MCECVVLKCGLFIRCNILSLWLVIVLSIAAMAKQNAIKRFCRRLSGGLIAILCGIIENYVIFLVYTEAQCNVIGIILLILQCLWHINWQ